MYMEKPLLLTVVCDLNDSITCAKDNLLFVYLTNLIKQDNIMSAAQKQDHYIVDFESMIKFIWDNPDHEMTLTLQSFFVVCGGVCQRVGKISFFDNTVLWLYNNGFATKE